MTIVDPAVAAMTFGLILPAELPDKTMVATLVLATRYRPLPVWLGASAAFVVQSLTAVVAGGLLAQLPHRPVLAGSAMLFAVGAAVLVRSELSRPPAEGDTEEPPPTPPVHSARRIASITFGVLFVAEWGDLSQLLTAGLAARSGAPVSVFFGATAALVLICGLAALAGRGLLRVLPVHVLRRAAGVLFGVLAVITALEAAGAT